MTIALLTAALAGASAAPAGAQSNTDNVQIGIAGFIQVPTAAESALRIDIEPRDAVPERAIVLIKGLPATISLSHGRLFDSGVWAVPVANIGELRMISGSATLGTTDFSVSLVTTAGTLLAQSNSSLAVVDSMQALEPTAAVQATDKVEPPAQQDTQPKARALPRPLTGQAPERLALYVQKGDDSMRAGNVNLARLFYTQAAEQGSAEGALALATTYDPVELAHMNVVGGIQPDPELAKRWYETAARLGSKLAETRLERLSAR